MDRKPLDVVTVVFNDELRLLKLQARSMGRYLDPTLVGSIYVIVNDRRPAVVRAFFLEHILPEYGSLKHKVRFLLHDDVWQTRNRRFGWQSQQALKLIAARQVKADSYLILDAKNHFVRPVQSDAFFAPDGRLRSHLYLMVPKFQQAFAAACDLFGLPGDHNGPCLPTTTPFLADRQLVTDMLQTIEARVGQPFEHYFMQAKGRYTEFSLYSAFHLLSRGGFEATYERRNCPTATLFRGIRAKPDRVLDVLSRLEDDEEAYCMGVHREILKVSDPTVLNLVKGAWARFDLVTEAKEQAYFMEIQDTLPKWRRFLPL